MLDKWEWSNTRSKVVSLPAKIRIKELKILAMQTIDKNILSEINDLLDKAKLEIQMNSQKDDGLDKKINEKLERLEMEREAERHKAQRLEDAVKDVPGPPPQKDKFENTIDYQQRVENGYLGQEYTPPGAVDYKMPGEESDRHKTNTNALLEEIESEHKKYRIS